MHGGQGLDQSAPKLNCPLFWRPWYDPDMFSDPQMSMEVFLNIYDVINTLISDQVAVTMEGGGGTCPPAVGLCPLGAPPFRI